MKEELLSDKEPTSFISGKCNDEFSEKIVLKNPNNFLQPYLQSQTEKSTSLVVNEELLSDEEPTSFISGKCNDEFSEQIVLKNPNNFFQPCLQSQTEKSTSLVGNEELLNDEEPTSFISGKCNDEFSEQIVLKNPNNFFQPYLQSQTEKSTSLVGNEELLNDEEPTSFISGKCNYEFSEQIVLKNPNNFFQPYLQSQTEKSTSLVVNEELLNNKESTSFVSEVCPEEFTEHTVLTDQDHVFQQHQHTTEASLSRTKERSHVCQVCNKEFSQKSKLDFHFLIHTRPFICKVCNQSFSRNSHLKDHFRVHTGEKPYTCEICHKEFSKKENLTKHLVVHTKEKKHFCEVCNKGFSQKSNLTAHLLTHTNKKDHVCQACNKRFYRKSHLDEHIRVHTQEKAFICGICSRAFNHKSALNMHFRLHTKEKAFICEICNKAFTHKSSLNLHYQVHSKVKSFVCGICNKAFSHKITLKKHHLRIHTKTELSEHNVLKDQDNDLFLEHLQTQTKISRSLSMNEKLLNNKESTSFVSEICNEEFAEDFILKDKDDLFQQNLKSHAKLSPNLSMSEELLNNKVPTSFTSQVCGEKFPEHIVLKDQDNLFQQYLQNRTKISRNMNEGLLSDKKPTSFVSEVSNDEFSEHIVLKDQDNLFQQYLKSHTNASPNLSMNEELPNNQQHTSFDSEICNAEFSEHIELKNQDNLFQQYLKSRTKMSRSLSMNEELLNNKEPTSFASEACGKEFSERTVLKDQDNHFQQCLENRTKISPNMNEGLLNDKKATSSISDVSNEEFSDHVPQQFSHTKERSFVCQVCDKEFSQKSKLDFHFLIHTRPFVCKVCNQTFSRNSHLKDHFRSHTGEKPFICETCHKEFSKKENLTKHRVVHTKEKRHFCEICNKGFSQKSNLRTHLLIHTNKKDHVCQACNKAFYRKAHLDEHIKVHTQEKAFICGICSRAFNHKSALNMHFRLHTKEKAFICEICNKAFTHKTSLNLHYQVHSKVKSFVCGICNKAFSHKMTLRKHHLRIHTNTELSEHILLKDQDNDLFLQYLQTHTKIPRSLSMNEEFLSNKESSSFVSEIRNEEFSEHIVLKDQDKLFQQYLESHTKKSISSSMNEEPLNNNVSTSFISEKCNEEFSEHAVLKSQDKCFQQYLESNTKKSTSLSMNEEPLNNKVSTSFISDVCNEEFSEHIILKDQDRIHTNAELSL